MGSPRRDAVVVAAVRTPTGKRNGGLSGIHSADLSAHVLRALVERTGLDPAGVDDVIWGCVTSTASAAPPSRRCTSPRPVSSAASTTSPSPAAWRS